MACWSVIWRISILGITELDQACPKAPT
jgi:hypothetical protein